MSDVRKVTYPPDFKYVERASIKDNMAKMAQQIALLDNTLAEPTTPEMTPQQLESRRQNILNALNTIGKVANTLKSDGGSNHPYMENFMGEFVAQVDKARNAASLAQPRYYYAGKVAGACASCHKVNRR